MYVPERGAEGPTLLPNPSYWWTFLGTGVWLLAMWLVAAGVLAIRYEESPLMGWANFPSRLLLGIGVAWLALTLFSTHLLTLANSPPALQLSRDRLEGTPPLRYRSLGGPRHLSIRFEMIQKVGWSLLGPAVLTNKRGPPGPGMLVTLQNAKEIRIRWTAWKSSPELA